MQSGSSNFSDDATCMDGNLLLNGWFINNLYSCNTVLIIITRKRPLAMFPGNSDMEDRWSGEFRKESG